MFVDYFPSISQVCSTRFRATTALSFVILTTGLIQNGHPADIPDTNTPALPLTTPLPINPAPSILSTATNASAIAESNTTPSSPSHSPSSAQVRDINGSSTPLPSVTPSPTPDNGLVSQPQGYLDLGNLAQSPADPSPATILAPGLASEEPTRTLDLLPTQDGVSTVSPASFIPWAKRDYLIITQNRRVGDVISDLCDQQGIKTIIYDSARGVISGRFEGKDPAKTLDQLCRSFNLMWYYNQGTLFVYGARELVTKIRTVYYATPENIISLLRSFNIISSDGGVTTVPGVRSIMVSGPPDFVKMVDSVISSQDGEQQFHQQGETVIEVFPLRYAWAYDIPLGPAGNGGATTITGVATVLNNLVNGGGSISTGPNYTTLGVPKPVQGALSPKDLSSTAQNGFYTAPQGNGGGSGGQGTGGGSSSGSGSGGSQGPPRPGSALAGGGPDQGTFNANGLGSGPSSQPFSYAQITADVRRNAVVIRDIRENMAFYKAAIEKLDVPVRIVEISAAVIDVQAGMGRTLGVDGVAVNGAGYGVGGTATGNQNFLGSMANGTAVGNGTNGAGLGFYNTANVANNPPNILGSGVFGTTRITATINALEAENKARTLSRPTVMTLDNFGATINQQQTFYVSATGQYVSNLFNISSGLSLQVVPHIVQGTHGEQIYLQVQIADGSITSQQVGQLPTVQQSTLTTQSLISKNQSLLVGGLYVKVDQKQQSGYPWLRKIPVIGTLFSVSSSNKNYVERLFLITPKIIELSNNNLGDYSAYFQPSPTEDEAIDLKTNPDAYPEWVDKIPVSKPIRMPWTRSGPKPAPTPSPAPSPRTKVSSPLERLFHPGKKNPSATPSPTPKRSPAKPKSTPVAAD